jgi:alpha(1,3/1,4) fucosyltransferase
MLSLARKHRMKHIQIDFCDFGPNGIKSDFYLYRVLAERFRLELCDQPDFLIFAPGGYVHRLHSGVRIFYSGESVLPDFRHCDYSVASVKLDDPRHLELPYYVAYGEAQDIVKKNDDPEKLLVAKTKFCSFVISGYNPGNNQNRVDFFRKLSKYKKVDSGGRKFNNIGSPVPRGGKVDFLRAYKFNIAFENRSLAGYATEKIFEPMQARCLPIYWGDPTINDHFNPRSFLNRADFASDEALIEKIIELDQNDDKYLEYLRQPYFHNDQPNRFFDRQRVLDFFENIFTRKITPVAQQRRKLYFFRRCLGRWIIIKRYNNHKMETPGW